MKRNPILVMLSLLFILATTTLMAQKASKEVKTLVISTSVVCDMCKEKIEKNLIFEKGVKEVSVDMQKKTVTVKYRSDKNTPENIKAALSKLGYRADEVSADPEAFKKLPDCCKKEGCGKD